jgi:tetratricopeptide (TPR) repeat protein
MQEMIRLATEEPEKTELLLTKVLENQPEDIMALRFLGLAKRTLGKYNEAIALFQQTIALSQDPETYNQMALCYREVGDFENAIKNMSKAVAWPTGQNWSNLGKLFMEVNQIVSSIECFERAINIDPKFVSAHYDLSLACGLLGTWARFFEEYEWRFDYYEDLATQQGNYTCVTWDGETSLDGKRVIVCCEQGYGDWIQFLRYIPELQQRGACVLLHCPLALVSLFRNQGYEAVVEQPEGDYHCSVMSLPLLLNKAARHRPSSGAAGAGCAHKEAEAD